MTTTVPLVHELDRTVWEQVAQHYRDEIRSGRLAIGDVLPANRKIASEWGISTSTSHRTVAQLRDEGWINTRPGKPPVVVGVPKAATLEEPRPIVAHVRFAGSDVLVPVRVEIDLNEARDGVTLKMIAEDGTVVVDRTMTPDQAEAYALAGLEAAARARRIEKSIREDQRR